MVHLTIAGLSADKRQLLLVDAVGAVFTLDVDSRLKAALGGDGARIGQLEIPMASTLRPRDIQARIRAGQTAEEVATAAQTTVERVMPYAAPVLAERGHMAERAQRASIRRQAGEPGARRLGEASGGTLRSHNVPADSVAWDAWRREDGRWTLTATFAAEAMSGTAVFTYDPPGNYVVAEDQAARWLIDDQTAADGAQLDELRSARERRQATTTADRDLPLGDDALELLDGDVSLSPAGTAFSDSSDAGEANFGEEQTADLTETLAAVRVSSPVEPIRPAQDTLGAEPPPEAFLDRVQRASQPSTTDLEGESLPSSSVTSPPSEADEEGPPARRPVKKSRGRASVPSWDEIMFGGRQE
jgi:hypothetical protein